MQGLHLRLRDIGLYLEKVQNGSLPINHAILGNLQDVFNLLPNLTTPKPNSSSGANGSLESASDNSELARAMSVKTNDQLMTIYLSSLIRAITAFHDLIENKIQNRRQQEEKEAKKEDAAKEKEGKDKDGKKANGTASGDEKEGKDGKKDDDTHKEKEKGRKKG